MSAPPDATDIGDLIMNSHLVHWVLTAASAILLYVTKFFFNKQMETNDEVSKTLMKIQKDQSYMMGHLGIKRPSEEE